VVYSGKDTFTMNGGVVAISLAELMEKLLLPAN
jgi:hypothetical protein